MSRREERRLQVEARWPTLQSFLTGYLHQDWPYFHSSPEEALDQALSESSLETHRTILREWRDWNQNVDADDDLREMVDDGFGVNVLFPKPRDAREFMDKVYEQVLASVKLQAEWKPK